MNQSYNQILAKSILIMKILLINRVNPKSIKIKPDQIHIQDQVNKIEIILNQNLFCINQSI